VIDWELEPITKLLADADADVDLRSLQLNLEYEHRANPSTRNPLERNNTSIFPMDSVVCSFIEKSVDFGIDAVDSDDGSLPKYSALSVVIDAMALRETATPSRPLRSDVDFTVLGEECGQIQREDSPQKDDDQYGRTIQTQDRTPTGDDYADSSFISEE